MSEENENSLMQRREDRRTLHKMRSKLATSGQVGKAGKMAKMDAVRPRSAPKRGIRIWPIALIATVILVGVNFALRTDPDRIMGLLGKAKTETVALAPRPGTSLDDQARFWAYALYDLPKFRTRFHPPRGKAIDKAQALKNLEILLADNLGTEVRNEIFVYQKNAPAPVSSRKIGAGRKIGP